MAAASLRENADQNRVACRLRLRLRLQPRPARTRIKTSNLVPSSRSRSVAAASLRENADQNTAEKAISPRASAPAALARTHIKTSDRATMAAAPLGENAYPAAFGRATAARSRGPRG